MKILHITASVDERNGGVADAVLRLAETCVRDGLTSGDEIVCLDLPETLSRSEPPITVHALGDDRPGRGPVDRFLNHYRYSPKFKPWLEANLDRFDLAIVHGLWNYAPFAASQVLPRRDVPYYVFPHGMMDPWFRKAYPRKHLLKQGFWTIGEGRLLAGARATLFTCEEEKRQARGAFWGHAYRSDIAPLGAVAPPPRTPALVDAFHRHVPAVAGRRFILFLGRIHPKKGCDLLVQAYAATAAKDPTLDLVVVGPDQEGWQAQLQKMAADLGVADRIHWPGPLFDDAKWGAYYAAEAFALPSHQENFGIVVAEAMACGLPVLITDKVNIWETVDQAGAGLVCSDDLPGVTDQLSAWMRSSPEDRLRMSEAARTLYVERYGLTMATKNIIALVGKDHAPKADSTP
ncbi:glycosyltransferase [Caulobacter soli]|uniref:glycosyltransferase n=1 Tax=Caulobacter soli TaxID=2708539 RepID=UPI0013EADEDD|nr:glycosyltransferase [Caulobacter soli]